MKGFIDRVFLPDIAFSYDKNNKKELLFQNKSARIIVTMEQPVWYYRFICRTPSINQLKTSTLSFCGIKAKRVKSTIFGSALSTSQQKREQWLSHVKNLGSAEAITCNDQPKKL
jgi:putative NADPH-quinone reductase